MYAVVSQEHLEGFIKEVYMILDMMQVSSECRGLGISDFLFAYVQEYHPDRRDDLPFLRDL